jgi:hypothetical protein
MTSNRNEAFVPLAAASPRPASERREFRATVISPSSQAQPFQSIAAAAAVIPSAANPAAHVAHGEPKVTLQRNGNQVTGIHIQCSCGQVMELSCVYDAAPAVQTAPAAQPAAAAQPATIPQAEAEAPAPGKKCKDSGKEMPSSTAKKAKTTEKSSGTSAAKRRSA